jgi:hypothetical protein
MALQAGGMRRDWASRTGWLYGAFLLSESFEVLYQDRACFRFKMLAEQRQDVKIGDRWGVDFFWALAVNLLIACRSAP